MSISAVGSPVYTFDVDNLTISPTNVGDLFYISYTQNSGTLAPSFLTNITAGSENCTFINEQSFVAANSPSIEGWYWIADTTSSTTFTLIDPSAGYSWYIQEYSTSTGVFALESSASEVASSGTSGNYPSLTVASSTALYVAAGRFTGAAPTIGGSTAGFTYYNPIGSTGLEKNHTLVYNPSCSSPNTYDPAWTYSTGSVWMNLASVFSAGTAANRIVMLP